MMDSLDDQFHPLIISVSGTIGAAFVDLLSDTARCALRFPGFICLWWQRRPSRLRCGVRMTPLPLPLL